MRISVCSALTKCQTQPTAVLLLIPLIPLQQRHSHNTALVMFANSVRAGTFLPD